MQTEIIMSTGKFCGRLYRKKTQKCMFCGIIPEGRTVLQELRHALKVKRMNVIGGKIF
jgi:hypothetical protein